MSEMIKVGMADLKITKHPNNLTTIGLGSCVGVCIYDTKTRIIGMAHVMLPDSSNSDTSKPGKFADEAVPELVKGMIKLGATKSNLICKIAGGASMFKNNSDFMKIGERNVDAVKKGLNIFQIKIVAQETGGSVGRTIEFMSDNGILIVKTHGKEFLKL